MSRLLECQMYMIALKLAFSVSNVSFHQYFFHIKNFCVKILITHMSLNCFQGGSSSGAGPSLPPLPSVTSSQDMSPAVTSVTLSQDMIPATSESRDGPQTGSATASSLATS